MNATGSAIILAAAALLCGPSNATTSGVSAGGFTISVTRDIAKPRQRVYVALGEISRWWSPAHTWSGDSRNLSMAPKAGGCFCERWGNNSVEHGRVINATQNQALILRAPLGPLQSLPVSAVLSFALAENNDGTRLTVTYAVAGGGTDLSVLAPPVDGVITEQVDRLVSFVNR